MIKKEINLYEFEELSPEVQEKVIDDFRDNNDFDFLEDVLRGRLNDVLNENHIKINDLTLRYSLSYNQGDGFSFIGDFVYKNNCVTIRKGHLANFYCHSGTNDIEILDKNDEENEELEKEFSELYVNICKELEKYGYEVIEDENNEETIKERIKDNDYYFREDGTIENL